VLVKRAAADNGHATDDATYPTSAVCSKGTQTPLLPIDRS
jgi:hypothetical protein